MMQQRSLFFDMVFTKATAHKGAVPALSVRAGGACSLTFVEIVGSVLVDGSNYGAF